MLSAATWATMPPAARRSQRASGQESSSYRPRVARVVRRRHRRTRRPGRSRLSSVPDSVVEVRDAGRVDDPGEFEFDVVGAQCRTASGPGRATRERRGSPSRRARPPEGIAGRCRRRATSRCDPRLRSWPGRCRTSGDRRAPRPSPSAHRTPRRSARRAGTNGDRHRCRRRARRAGDDRRRRARCPGRRRVRR